MTFVGIALAGLVLLFVGGFGICRATGREMPPPPALADTFDNHDPDDDLDVDEWTPEQYAAEWAAIASELKGGTR